MMKTLLIIAICSLVISSAIAQDSSESLAREAANPVADLMSFPFQNNTDFGIGSFDRARNVLNIQPVIPFAGGKVITRTIIPIVSLPDITTEDESLSSGLSDINFTAFYVPETQGLTLGFGPVISLPTGGELRGSEKWSVGPSFVALKQEADWTLGILANNIWSIAGDSDRNDINMGLLQYFIVRQLGNGWYVNSAPILTVDWNAETGNQWTVPFGAGAGKVSFLGKLPLNVQIGAFYNVITPDFGADWQLRVQAQFLLPKSIFSKK